MKNILNKFLISFLTVFIFGLVVNSNFVKAANLDLTSQNTILELQQKVKELENMIAKSKISIDTESNSYEYLEAATQYPKLILYKFAELFRFVLDKSDKMTSKKFVIAFCMAIGPLIALYCSVFDAQPLLSLINSFFSYSSKSATDAGVAFSKGAIEGVVDSALDNKLAITGIAGGGISLYTVWIFFSQIIFKVAGATGDRLGLYINPK